MCVQHAFEWWGHESSYYQLFHIRLILQKLECFLLCRGVWCGVVVVSGGGPTADSGWQCREQQLATVRACTNAYLLAHRPSLGAVLVGDFNISPFERDLSVNHEWPRHSAWFESEVHCCHLSADTQQHKCGTVYEMVAGSAGVGWDVQRLQQWTVKPERVDHVLSVRYACSSVSGAGAAVQRRLEWAVPRCELVDDAMSGTSDHLAVRATIHLALPAAAAAAPAPAPAASASSASASASATTVTVAPRNDHKT